MVKRFKTNTRMNDRLIFSFIWTEKILHVSLKVKKGDRMLKYSYFITSNTPDDFIFPLYGVNLEWPLNYFFILFKLGIISVLLCFRKVRRSFRTRCSSLLQQLVIWLGIAILSRAPTHAAILATRVSSITAIPRLVWTTKKQCIKVFIVSHFQSKTSTCRAPSSC